MRRSHSDIYQSLKIRHRMDLHRATEQQLKRSKQLWNDELTAQLVHDKEKLEMELLSFIPPTFFRQITEPLTRKL